MLKECRCELDEKKFYDLQNIFETKKKQAEGTAKLIYEMNHGFIRPKFVQLEKVDSHITEAINSSKPFFVGRVGRTEGIMVNNWLNSEPFSDELMDFGQNNAGITPKTQDAFVHFSRVYLDAAKSIDLFGLFGTFEYQAEIARITDNRAYTMVLNFSPLDLIAHGHRIDPANAWTHALKDKKVLVVHPFALTIQNQYKVRNKIHFVSKLLPQFELITLCPPQTSAGNHGTLNFKDELEKICSVIQTIDFDIALVGAGGYGLPIGSCIKKMGRTALVLGGTVQTLFGIIGNRWEKRYAAANLLGEGWVRPSKEETPVNANRVERACYW